MTGEPGTAGSTGRTGDERLPALASTEPSALVAGLISGGPEHSRRFCGPA